MASFIIAVDFCSVVPEALGTANNLTEEKIAEKCFDLIFSLDEVRARKNAFEYPLIRRIPFVARLSQLVDIKRLSPFNKSERIWKWKATKKSFIK